MKRYVKANDTFNPGDIKEYSGRYSPGRLEDDGTEDFYMDTQFNSFDEACCWGVEHDCTHLYDRELRDFVPIPIEGATEPKYFANMVNASYEGCDYQPNFRFNDDYSGEEESVGKYHAYSYYDSKCYGLEDDFISDDPSAVVDWIWDHAAQGGYIELSGPDGSIRLDPDELAERVEMGDIGEYDIISQVDESV